MAKSSLGVDSLTKDALVSRAKDVAQSQLNQALEKGKELVKSKAADLGAKAVDTLKGKVAPSYSLGLLPDSVKNVGQTVLSQSVKDTIKSIASNPQVKKALASKAKDIIKHPKLNADSTAMLSNIIAGSGIKRSYNFHVIILYNGY